MENNEEFKKAISEKNVDKLTSMVKANPTLVKALPEGEFGEEISKIAGFVKKLDDFSSGFISVAQLPDDFFLNNACVDLLKESAKKRYLAIFGDREAEETIRESINALNDGIDERVRETEARAKFSEMKEEEAKKKAEAETEGWEMGTF